MGVDAFEQPVTGGAHFSDDKIYRYSLARTWNFAKPHLVCIGINPSKADHIKDDPTVRVVMGRARRMGLGGIYMLNLFALVSTDPKALITTDHDRIGPENNKIIQEHMRDRGHDFYLAAWGDNVNNFPTRRHDVLCYAKQHNIKLHALGLTKSNNPKHPLRISYDVQPFVWKGN